MRDTLYHVDGCPMKIALLCDSHNRPCARVLSSLRRNRPDMIAVAGDFVDGHVSLEGHEGLLMMERAGHAMELLEGCAAVAPTFVSLGNHEWMLNKRDVRMIQQAGCRVLDDGWERFGPLVVGGLSSGIVPEYRQWRSEQLDRSGYIRVPKNTSLTADNPRTDWLDGFCNQEGFHVLLSHHPEYWPKLKSWDIELVLSGHAHGGQWRYLSPSTRRWAGVFAPGQGPFPQVTSGVYDDRLVVSRGLSNTAPVPRLFNPVEVVYIVGC